LTRKGFIAMGATKKPFTFFIVIAFAYLGMTIVSTLTLEALERRANRGVRRA
jgi:ABC-type arginine transport system permease subunit